MELKEIIKSLLESGKGHEDSLAYQCLLKLQQEVDEGVKEHSQEATMALAAIMLMPYEN